MDVNEMTARLIHTRISERKRSFSICVPPPREAWISMVSSLTDTEKVKG
jgi:hypothetical protein